MTSSVPEMKKVPDGCIILSVAGPHEHRYVILAEKFRLAVQASAARLDAVAISVAYPQMIDNGTIAYYIPCSATSVENYEIVRWMGSRRNR